MSLPNIPSGSTPPGVNPASAGGWWARIFGAADEGADLARKRPPLVERGWNWLMSWSLAARVAWIVFICLVALVLVTWLVLYDPDSIPAAYALSWWRIAAVCGLVIAIPLIVYQGLRLWLEVEPGAFPDIDFAWNSGLESLSRNGLSLESTPLFLVLGSPGDDLERSVIDAAQLNLRIRGAPEGASPLHWYGNAEGIYLMCTDVGWASALAAVKQKIVRRKERSAAGDDTTTSGADEPDRSRATIMPGALQAVTIPEPQPRGTVRDSSGAIGGAVPKNAAGQMTRGTMMSQANILSDSDATPRNAATRAVEDHPVLVTSHASSEQLQRLEYVCQMLRRARGPLCTLNGVIAMLPFDLIQGKASESEELQQAVRADLMTVQDTLHLRCPVTALVTGLERETGFRELVLRANHDQASGQRFGRRYDVRATATAEDMAALGVHVCGAFEDWVYSLFRESDVLARPGNTRLYGLLCKVRCVLKLRLSEILADGFGYDAQRAPHETPLMFSGCYFGATGETKDKQAFVKGVFDKMIEEQEQVEWTRQALRREHRYGWMAALAILLSGGLCVSLVYMLSAHFLSG